MRKSLIGEEAADGSESKPEDKGFHILLIDRSIFLKKVRIFPSGWKLPPTITGKLVKCLYSM
jgi:hypothetical protein